MRVNKTETTISLQDVTVSFASVKAVDNVTLDVPPGSTLALVGPNGSGKTTILNVMAKLQHAHEGRVETNAKTTAYVTQQSHNKTWLPLTAKEIVGMGRYKKAGLIGRLNAADKKAIDDAAQRFELDEFLGSQYWELSGGQQQRVRIAQAVVQEPDLLLLDEPLTGLDIPNQNTILSTIIELAENGLSVVLTTHSLDLANHCDRIALIAKRLVAFGEPSQILNTKNLQTTFGGHVLTDFDDPSRSHLLVEEHHH